MVEAAIYFPIAVFCAMAVMALLLNIYSQTATQAHLHVRLRAEAAAVGDRTQARLTDAYARDRYRREAESVSFAIDDGGEGLRKWKEASRTLTYRGGRFTNPRGYETDYYGRSYIVDEARIARLKDAVMEILE
ncbi:MAG: hypothetical protein FWG03_06480 [Clostridiales bacterium]|nr:hypothetical protein [Clostridiales bacterium]